MIESVESKDGMTIYWFAPNKKEKSEVRVGVIINKPQNFVTDEIASGYDLGYSMLGDTVDGLEKQQP